MTGQKHTGTLISEQCEKGLNKGCEDKFRHPGSERAPVKQAEISLGILDHYLDTIADGPNSSKTYKVCFDGKKTRGPMVL